MKHLNYEGISRELLKYKADESTALVFLQPLTPCPVPAAAGVGPQHPARWCWALLVLPGTWFKVHAASSPSPEREGGFGYSPLLCFLSLSPPTEFPSCDGALHDFVPGRFPAIVALQKPSCYYKTLMGAMSSAVRWQLAGERVFKWCLFMPFQRKYNEAFAVGIDVGHFSEIYCCTDAF